MTCLAHSNLLSLTARPGMAFREKSSIERHLDEQRDVLSVRARSAGRGPLGQLFRPHHRKVANGMQTIKATAHRTTVSPPPRKARTKHATTNQGILLMVERARRLPSEAH